MTHNPNVLLNCGVAAFALALAAVHARACKSCRGLAQCVPPSPARLAVTSDSDEVQTFVVLGDYGTHSAGEAAVAAMVQSWNPDFIVTVGDNNYGNLSTQWELNVGAYYGEFILGDASGGGNRFPNQISATQRFFPSLGNHDTTGGPAPGGSAAAYLDYFHDEVGGGAGRLPTGAGVHTSTDTYYDFVKGDIHFWAVDSDHATTNPSSMADQKSWLQTGLANSASKWNFVYFHYPPYSSGDTHGISAMRWPFQEWGADVVLAGHDHIYERIIIGDFPYFISGLGGASLAPLRTPIPGSQVRYNDDYGAMRVIVNGDEATFEFLSITNGGTLIDTYTLNRCYPDCDPNGVLDIFDFLCFQNSFVVGEPYACACDPDPVCDIFDFLCFQNAFVGGCN